MIRQRFRNIFTRQNKRPTSRLESLPAHTPTPALPELAPRLSSRGPRSVPNGSARAKKRHNNSRRRNGHGKNHPAHRQHQRAKDSRKANVRRLIAAKS